MTIKTDETTKPVLGDHLPLLDALRRSLAESKTMMPEAETHVSAAGKTIAAVASRVGKHREDVEMQDTAMRAEALRDRRHLAVALFAVKLRVALRIVGLYAVYVSLAFVLFLIRVWRILAIGIVVIALVWAALVYGPTLLAEIDRLVDHFAGLFANPQSEPHSTNPTSAGERP